MKKLSVFSLFLCLISAFGQDRLPLHEREGMGFLDKNVSVETAARNFLVAERRSKRAQKDFRRLDTHVDNLGQVHIRFQPLLNGLPVYGDHVILHADNTSAKVLAITGEVKVADDFTDQPALDEKRVARKALSQLGIIDYRVVSRPELAFVVDSKRRPTLAWSFRIEYQGEEGPRLDQIFADAKDGSVAAVHPKYYYGRNRMTYSANNTSSTPGTLVRSEGQAATGDACADAAHDYAGDTYDYYAAVHGRDSYDNAGATMVSTVHYQSNLNNAYWTGSQMLYGDGDGVTFTCLAQSRDVVAHELTHAVTERTANLIYQNESGALNEAMSDILGVATDAWAAGGVSSATWLLGEDVYTPGTNGDALRYMNNPTQDGQSYDYYPERYTGSADYGGVHLNSGIANLAFYLLVEGGTHPRGKTSTVVTGIGISDAAKIFYRALSVYMSSSTNFAGAAEDTIQAATDLFGASSTQAVQTANAWDAVGVAIPQPPQTIGNGDSVSLTESTGTWRYFILTIPSGATNLSVTTSAGNGDADLYTRMGAKPTTSTYLCRSYTSSSNETCTDASPSAGDLYIGVYA
ncbi:MAG: M4 family metallopeptidase, partial [Acidobacteriota bacterium]|nr:M4 family metallopeptidase [Acidobacteriota bacterium]